MSLEKIGVRPKTNPLRQSFKPVFTEDALDWKIHRAAQTPAPGEYGCPDQKIIKGGSWGSQNPKSYLDMAEWYGKQTPGPGAYNTIEALKKQQRGANNGRFNMSKPKTFLENIEYLHKGIPGPATYNLSTASPTKGGKFNMSKSKTELDWIIYRTSQLPAPGVYGVWNPQMNGGKFNLANPKTPLDWQILQAQKLPGPGQYHSMTDASSSMSGGKFNTSKSKSEVEWIIHRAKKLPGPGEYDVEKSSKLLAKNVPKFSFQGRPGPPELPEPFANYSTSRLGTASMSRRSKTAASEASRSLNSSMSSLPEVKGGSGSDVLVVDEKSCDSLRSSSSFRPREGFESRKQDVEKRFIERQRNAYNKSTMRRKAASMMGYGSSFFL